MAKLEVNVIDIKKQIKELQLYRSSWGNDIREKWNGGIQGAKELTFDLYQISGCIILALQETIHGRFQDKMAMIMVKRKLLCLTHSQNYQNLDKMGQKGLCNTVTTETKHHIRIMMECLNLLTA